MAEKLFEKLTGNEKAGLVVTLLVVIAVSVSAGYMGADQIDDMITGLTVEEETELPEADETDPDDGLQQETDYEMGEDMSIEEIEGTVEELMEQELAMQEQQMDQMAAESEELDSDDFYMESDITDVTESAFEALYQVTVSISGEMPSQMDPETTESVEEEDILYITRDGNFLFNPPQDLEAGPEEEFEPPEELGEEASEEEIEKAVSDMIDDEMAMQQEQFDMMAAQDEEIEDGDFHMEGEVTEMEESAFPSFYEVTLHMTGEVPSQMDPSETEEIDEESEMFVSVDGRYMFMPPQDISMIGQQPQMQGEELPDDLEDEIQ